MSFWHTFSHLIKYPCKKFQLHVHSIWIVKQKDSMMDRTALVAFLSQPDHEAIPYAMSVQYYFNAQIIYLHFCSNVFAYETS